MSQSEDWGVPLVGPATPTAMASRMQGSLDALLSAHKGAARPAYATAGTLWVDDSAGATWSVFVFDGAEDILIGTLNTASNVFSPNIPGGAVSVGKLDTTVQNALVPSGAIIFVALNSAPAGYLKANGAAVSRSTYAALFAAIGTTFGAGNGSTTFNLPDLRGEFPRGWDDGRGVDSGRTFGSAQGDAIRNITGSVGQVYRAAVGSGSGALGMSAFGSMPAATGNSGTHPGDNANIIFNASNAGVPTASENRPRNVALLACIKF
jgi:microcystin-dependent protein